MSAFWDEVNRRHQERLAYERSIGIQPEEPPKPKGKDPFANGGRHTGSPPQFDRAEMVRLYVEERWSVPRIATHLGCHKQTVYSALDAAGVQRRDDRLTLPGPKPTSVCGNNHVRTEKNTRIDAYGHQRCRDCDRERAARRRAKKQEARDAEAA